MKTLKVLRSTPERSEVGKTFRVWVKSFKELGEGLTLVKKGADYIGILSETDIVRKALAEGLGPETCTVEQVMSAPIITIDVEQSIANANEIMSARKIRHLVVTERGEVAGIISVRDLVLYYKNRL